MAPLPEVPPTPPCETVQCKIVAAFPDAPVMVAIAEAESQFKADAANPKSTARGVFQILIGTWYDYDCEGTRYNVDDSIVCARKIYNDRGTNPWNSSKHHWNLEA